MKIIKLLFVILFLGILSSCKPFQSKDDPGLLKKAVTGYFSGIENKDFNIMKSITTDDFVLYEDGLVWNNDSVFLNIKRNLPFTVKYKMDNFRTYVDNSSGDMTYTNHADFVFADTIKLSLDWIESATFRKIDGVWKMNFLHITQRK